MKFQRIYQKDRGSRISKPICFTCGGDSTHFARACLENNNHRTRSRIESADNNLVTTERTIEVLPLLFVIFIVSYSNHRDGIVTS